MYTSQEASDKLFFAPRGVRIAVDSFHIVFKANKYFSERFLINLLEVTLTFTFNFSVQMIFIYNIKTVNADTKYTDFVFTTLNFFKNFASQHR